MDCQQCLRATLTHAAVPISCDALLADGPTALPAPLRFLPLPSQTDKSPDLSPLNPPDDIASDLLEVPELPVSPSEATHASPTNDVTAWTQVFGVTAEPSSLSLDEIREAQSVNIGLMVVCAITRKRHAYSSPSGIHSSSRKASCIVDITILTAPLGTCKWCYLSSSGVRMSSVCTLTLDILEGLKA